MAKFNIKRGLDTSLYMDTCVPDSEYTDPQPGDLVVVTGATSDNEFKVVSGSDANQAAETDPRVLVGCVFEAGTFSSSAIGKISVLFGFGEIETDNFNDAEGHISSSTPVGTPLTCIGGMWDILTSGEGKTPEHINGYLKYFDSANGTITVVCVLQ
jgi:hypothetical protein